MGSLSIQKGKRAERAVANVLNPIIERVCQREGVDVQKLQRNLKQVQQGGFDLDGLDWIAIEIKHHKQTSLGSWWAQTLKQATGERLPVLIWKPHGGQWRVRMRGQIALCNGQAVRCVIDMPDMDSFLVWFELELTLRIRGAIAKGDSQEIAEHIGLARPSSSTSAVAPEIAAPPAPVPGIGHKKPWE
jgi:hypothetical protein